MTNPYQFLYRVVAVANGRLPLKSKDNDSKDTPPDIKRHPFALSIYYVEFNGVMFKTCLVLHRIKYYEGVKEMKSLNIVPSTFSPGLDTFHKELIARNRVFLQFRGPQHCMYNETDLEL